jgi:RNA polymerase sigma factor for flagellar operon FliA
MNSSAQITKKTRNNKGGLKAKTNPPGKNSGRNLVKTKPQLENTRQVQIENVRPAKVDIEKVWVHFHKSHEEQYRNLLMENYRYLVRYTAERLHTKLPDKVELDDLMSAGNFGLMDAIDAFDPNRGVKFETYCSPRIRGSILDELRSMDWVPRLVRARGHQLSRAKQSLEAHLGRKPSNEELAEELDMDIVEFGRLQQDAEATGIVSLDSQYGDEEGEKDIREIDVIKDRKSEDPTIEAQKRDLRDLLTKGLTRAERLIVVLYYYEEMTMKEIGATLDLSESRVSQMHSSILLRLKAQLNTRKREFSS